VGMVFCLSSDSNGAGSTPGGTLELDTGFYGLMKCVVISKQWVIAVEDCGCN